MHHLKLKAWCQLTSPSKPKLLRTLFAYEHDLLLARNCFVYENQVKEVVAIEDYLELKEKIDAYEKEPITIAFMKANERNLHLWEQVEMMAEALEKVKSKSPGSAPNYAGKELDKYNKFKEGVK